MKGKSGKGLSRRDFLKYSGVAAATGVLSGVGTRISSAKGPGEELVVGFSGDPGHMDPRVEGGVIGWSIFHHMYQTAIFFDKDTNPIPLLAEKWEQVTPTALRWHLRKGVKFHNGEDFTAESVKFSIKELAAPTSRHPSKSRMEPVKDFKIHDAHTIDLITEKPNRPLLRDTHITYMVSPRAVRELGTKLSANPVGTGQFKFVEYRPGEYVLMEANPDYWGKKAKLKRLRVRFIKETGTRVASLETGEVMMINNVPPDKIPRLRANPNLKVILSPTNRVIFVSLQCDREPFNDKRVRQAMNYAIDKEAITKGIMGGMMQVATAPLSQGVFAAHPGLSPYKYDPERARKLLAQAGAIGVTLNFGAPHGRYVLDRQVGEAIASYLSAVGLNVKFENPPWGTFVSEITKFKKSKYDGYLYGMGTSNGEPDAQMSSYYHSSSSRHLGCRNPEVDRLIAEAAMVFDVKKVKALYHQAQEIVWDECPWIWTYEQPDIFAINKKLNWRGVGRDERMFFHDASLKA